MKSSFYTKTKLFLSSNLSKSQVSLPRVSFAVGDKPNGQFALSGRVVTGNVATGNQQFLFTDGR
jgi:hypothetical protein